MATHSRDFPPSASKRWLTCPRSVSLIRSLGAVERRSSVYAAQGTLAHTVGEVLLANKTPPAVGSLITTDGHVVAVDQEMIECATLYADTVKHYEMDLNGIVYTEAQVSLDELVGPEAGCTGTCDAIILGQTAMAVVDYKHGRGIEVDVEDNPQLLIYALGAFLGLTQQSRQTIETVELVIVQPRVPGGLAVKIQQIYTLDLIRWGKEVVKPVIDLVMSGQAEDIPFVTSEACRFCPAAAHCPALKTRAQQAAKQAFTAIPAGLDPAVNMSDRDLSDALDESEIMKLYIEAVAAEALLRAKSGKDIPGRKLVAKRGVRQWIDPALAELTALSMGATRENIFTRPVLKSPAQVALFVDKSRRKELTSLAKVVSSGVSLVRTSDPRPAVEPVEGAAMAFGALPLDDQDSQDSQDE